MKQFIGELTFEAAAELLGKLNPDVAANFMKLIKAGIIYIGFHEASERGYIDRLLNILSRKVDTKEPATI